MIPLATLAGFVGFASLVGFACTTELPPAPDAVRFIVAIEEGRTLGGFTLSRDGNWLAYSAEVAGDGRRIFVKDLRAASESDREVRGTRGGVDPFFSPDGGQIGYFANRGVWRTSATGNAGPVRVGDAPADAAGGAWTDDGRIVIAPQGNRGLVAMRPEGGAETPLTVPEKGDLAHGLPHPLPGGGILFTVSQRNRDPHLEVVSSSGARTRLRVPAFGQAAFVETGHLVYSYLGNLTAVKFDPEDPAAIGVPVVVAKGVHTSSSNGTLGRAGLAVSRSGTLVWLRAAPDDAKSHVVTVRADGEYRRLVSEAAVYQTPRLSPDGRLLAVTVRPGVMTREIHVMAVARPDHVLTMMRGGDNQSPAWVDNRRLSFGSNRDGAQQIYVASVGGTVSPLLSDVSKARNPASWTHPPRLLALYEIDLARGRDVLLYRAGHPLTAVVATPANERSPVLSPDGRWLAYVSDASGRDEVHLKPVDLSMEAVQLTNNGASEPMWTSTGLFYREGNRMMRVILGSGPPGALQTVFEGEFERDPGANLAAYDVAPDGTFVMLKTARVTREVRVVQHWGTELARAVH